MIKQKCIDLNSADEWRDCLKGISHSFGHTWESCYAMSLSTGGDNKTFLYYFEVDDVRIVCPILEREFGNQTDITTPYGFSGFTGTTEYLDFPYYWKKFAENQNYVCGYIGLHPFFRKDTYFEVFDYHEYNDIYILNLLQNENELLKNLSSNRKRQVKNWQKNIFSYRKDLMIDFFITNYYDFMKQRKATSIYQFSKDTLLFLLNLDNTFIIGAGQPQKIEAVSLFAYTPHMGEFLFNVSLPEGKQHSVPLIWEAVHHLKSLDIPSLNLGGGVHRNDSLANFKERFGSEKMPLGCLKQVYKPNMFKYLCLSNQVNPTDSSGYFPPYRSPNKVS
jgi:hypothetical protein